jgi:hypothetical protein
MFATALTALTLVTAAGCASTSDAKPAMAGMHGNMHAGDMKMSGNMQGDCPMMVANTTVRADDVDGGASMVFTTTGDVAQLRERVAKLAAHHNAMQQSAGGSGMAPPSTARAEDVEGGARMIITPKSPSDLEALRTHVRDHAAGAHAGECPMGPGMHAGMSM